MTTTHKPKTLFWVIAVIALLWNIMGITEFYIHLTQPEWALENYDEKTREFLASFPTWFSAIFGIATISGLVASITMLLRKKITVTLFLVSLITVIVTQLYWMLFTDAKEYLGSQTIVMPILVIIFSFFLYFYTKKSKEKGWLH